MSTNEDEDIFIISEEFIEDDLGENLSLENLIEFKAEIYQLSHLSVEPTTSTPVTSFSTSPKSATKGGRVKTLKAIYENSDPNISFVSERTRANMASKLPRNQKLFEKFEVEVKRAIVDLDKAIGTEDTEKVQEFESELKAYKSTLQADIDRMSTETYKESELEESATLEHRAKMFLVKISKSIDKAKRKTQKTKTEVTPMTAGKVEKLDLPEFEGDYTKYKFFRTRFQALTAVFDKITTKIYLTEKLRGKAREYVRDLIIQDASLEDLWRALDSHFGNEQNIIDATVKSYFDLARPIKNINKFEEFFVQSKNRAASVVDLGHSPEELLAAYFMLQIPGEYRSELEKKLSIKRDREGKNNNTRYKFADLSPLVDEFVRIMKMSCQNDNETERELQHSIPVKSMLGTAYNNYEANYASQVQNANVWESEDTRGSQHITVFWPSLQINKDSNLTEAEDPTKVIAEEEVSTKAMEEATTKDKEEDTTKAKEEATTRNTTRTEEEEMIMGIFEDKPREEPTVFQ